MKKAKYSEAFSEVERKRDNPALMVTSQQHLCCVALTLEAR